MNKSFPVKIDEDFFEVGDLVQDACAENRLMGLVVEKNKTDKDQFLKVYCIATGCILHYGKCDEWQLDKVQ